MFGLKERKIRKNRYAKLNSSRQRFIQIKDQLQGKKHSKKANKGINVE